MALNKCKKQQSMTRSSIKRKISNVHENVVIPSSSKSWIGKYITIHESKPILHEAEGRVLDWFYSSEELYIFQSNFLNWMGSAFLYSL